MSGILIVSVKKQDQSKQRKMNSNKLEKERLGHPSLLMLQQIFGICSKFCKSTALTYEKRQWQQQTESRGFILRRNPKGYGRFHWDSAQTHRRFELVFRGPGSGLHPLPSAGPRASGSLLLGHRQGSEGAGENRFPRAHPPTKFCDSASWQGF